MSSASVAASGLGACKAYDTYGRVDNTLMMENIEALSDENPEGDNGGQTVIHYTVSERTVTIHEYNELGQIVKTITYKEPCCLITQYGKLECCYVLCDS